MFPQLFTVQLRLFTAYGFPAVLKAEAHDNNRLPDNNFCFCEVVG
ncbi:hypothetical protein [Dysgonomonas mossii]